MRYGEEEILNFTPAKLELWENPAKGKNYWIKITLPEWMAKCPRSGYPDFATIYLEYIPDQWVVELKALKLYINSFMKRYISHEGAANEIFETLYTRLKPKKMKMKMVFNPRGNVQTTIEIDSQEWEKEIKEGE
jgi:7-cyano-7-deazaguanine reductase